MAQRSEKLLALKMERGDSGTLESSRSWIPKGNRFSPRDSRRELNHDFTFILACEIVSAF